MSSKHNKKSKMHNLDYNPHTQFDLYHNIVALYMPIIRWLGTFNLLCGGRFQGTINNKSFYVRRSSTLHHKFRNLRSQSWRNILSHSLRYMRVVIN
jgi:hypothetical protein